MHLSGKSAQSIEGTSGQQFEPLGQASTTTSKKTTCIGEFCSASI
jgi:hypothetical protein